MKKLLLVTTQKVWEHIDEPEQRTTITTVALNAFYWSAVVFHLSTGRIGNLINDIWGGAQDAGFSPHELLEDVLSVGSAFLLAFPLLAHQNRRTSQCMNDYKKTPSQDSRSACYPKS